MPKRIDSLVEYYNGKPISAKAKRSNYKTLLHEIFLPSGYPSSVTDDYLAYQFWDTVQAMASSLTGVLSTAAILKGAGVGDQSATVLSAALSWILKDGAGMIGRIIFAWSYGTFLDSDSKRWRLMADLLNDVSFFVDILAGTFPPSYFVVIVCLSSLMRSIVGVAGGATRMAIIRHQARRENLADVAAKDGSQETLVGLFSLVLSLLMLPMVENNKALVWILFVLLTITHLIANYKAVSVLEFDVFNENRLKIVANEYVESGRILSIKEANARENTHIFKFTRRDRFYGCPLRQLLQFDQDADARNAQNKIVGKIGHNGSSGAIAFMKDATPNDIILAAFQLEFEIRNLSKYDPIEFQQKLQRQGWCVHSHLILMDEYSFTC
ncbi:unnamed protein product [Bursaphelenchus xylophilus]|uniref:(pine wood nematode) hypothetical protein n=1 Tax=Bursaphelenchus xylophilus TaxID=6326 RepID=A0A7I8WXM8_BURXY|nr:unnamed protein product [Bursaphelenchus xylophilus]CAG9100423.1 unnamed protein product [Bursaphelenchus xylophilus]